MKSSLSIWQLLHNLESNVKILLIFVAFLKNMNFKLSIIQSSLQLSNSNFYKNKIKITLILNSSFFETGAMPVPTKSRNPTI